MFRGLCSQINTDSEVDLTPGKLYILYRNLDVGDMLEGRRSSECRYRVQVSCRYIQSCGQMLTTEFLWEKKSI